MELSDNPTMQELLAAKREVEDRLLQTRGRFAKVSSEYDETSKTIRDTRTDTSEQIYAWRRELEQRIAEAQEALEVALKDLTQLQAELDGEKWDLRNDIRKDERDLASIERQIDQLRRAELKASEWATLADRWDKMTMGLPWREWAKDHQIEGAKKMTYEGRMILGDTMGLGKTLTSLIFIDMVEAATRDASPENPKEFGRA